MRRTSFIAFALAGALSISADEPAVVLEQIAGGFSRPVGIESAGDSRLFVVEQGGVIRIWDGNIVRPEPFLDLSTQVTSDGERGLLGLAFHPRFQENGRFFVNYTDLNGTTVIARYTVSPVDPDRADAASARELLRIAQPFRNHNGGQLQFGPDGYLYIGTGDGGSGGDPGNRAQNRADLLGKMLRLDVDGPADGDPYAIPSSNPFVDSSSARGEIWALGLRNPWRFTFDRVTGDLWIADVGQGDFEEVNFQPTTSIGGENYGWRRMEGTHCYNPQQNCNDGTLTLPVIEYDHSGGACSVTGGYVYRGTRNPRLNGSYLSADFCTGVIRAAKRDSRDVLRSTTLIDAPFRVSTFGEDALGEIYVADYTGGVIHRIVDTAPIVRRRAVRP